MEPANVALLEQAIVRHCSPTLAGLKPAGLFTFPGRFSPVCERLQGEAECWAARERFLRVVARCREELAGTGVELRVLVWRACGALVYVYRPRALAAYLEDVRARIPLGRMGYPARDTEAAIGMLAGRIAEAGPRGTRAHRPVMRAEGRELSQGRVPPQGRGPEGVERTCPCDGERCRAEFPHEMGYFLGYPYADVAGFIRQHGKDYLAKGQWKVYEDLPGALRTFERYRRCTAAFDHAYRRCGDLHGLAVRAR